MLPDKVRFSTELAHESSAVEQNATELRKQLEWSVSEPDAGLAGFDVAIEAAGAEPCLQTAVHSLRAGGSFVQTGLGNGNVNFPISTVLENEITVKGCFRYCSGDFKLALEMAMLGKVDLKPLITKIVPFRGAIEAWETAKRGEDIKTLIRVGL